MEEEAGGGWRRGELEESGGLVMVDGAIYHGQRMAAPPTKSKILIQISHQVVLTRRSAPFGLG